MRLTVSPLESLADEPIRVLVEGLAPGYRVELTAELVDCDGRAWQSIAHFDAGNDGIVDTARQASVGGTYDGIDPFGLIWSMLPIGSDAETGSFPSFSPIEPHRIEISVWAEGNTCRCQIKRGWCAPGVATRTVREGALRGIYYAPRNFAANAPAALVISGSGGGVSETLAPLLASRGVPTLALGYFAYEDLPEKLSLLPLEYFVEGARWLRAHTGLKRLVGIAVSRGTDALALTQIHFPEFADGLVLYVPSHIVESGLGSPPGRNAPWTVDGTAVPFQSRPPEARNLAITAQKGPKSFTPISLSDWHDNRVGENAEDYLIPFERIHVPLLLISGANDALWPSWISCARIVERMRMHDPNARVEHLSFQGAGHAISRTGTIMSLSAANTHKLLNLSIALGGVPRLNAAASIAAFQRVLTFLVGTVN